MGISLSALCPIAPFLLALACHCSIAEVRVRWRRLITRLQEYLLTLCTHTHTTAVHWYVVWFSDWLKSVGQGTWLTGKALFGLGWFPWGIWFDLNHRPMKMLLDSMVLFADMDWGSNLEGWVGQRSLWSRIKRLLVEEEWWQWWLTLFNLLPGQLLAGPGRPLDDVGEADAEPDQLPVVVRVHRSRDQTGQEQAFPWKEEYWEI